MCCSWSLAATDLQTGDIDSKVGQQGRLGWFILGRQLVVEQLVSGAVSPAQRMHTPDNGGSLVGVQSVDDRPIHDAGDKRMIGLDGLQRDCYTRRCKNILSGFVPSHYG